jgi:hypothetical protein
VKVKEECQNMMMDVFEELNLRRLSQQTAIG